MTDQEDAPNHSVVVTAIDEETREVSIFDPENGRMAKVQGLTTHGQSLAITWFVFLRRLMTMNRNPLILKTFS